MLTFDPGRVYAATEGGEARLTVDALPASYQAGLAEFEADQHATPGWKDVEGVRQLASSAVVFMPDESDVPAPRGTLLGKVGCTVFVAAGGGLVEMLLSDDVPSWAIVAVGASVAASVALMVRAQVAAKRAPTPVLRTGLYLFPDALLLLRTVDVQVFPRARILAFRVVPWTQHSTRTSVVIRGVGGEEESHIVGVASRCPALERWREPAL